MKNLLPFCFLLAMLPAVVSAQLSPGTIRALQVQGDVSLRIDATGATRGLSNGDTFEQGTTVLTGAASSVLLIQSNGASIRLEENTSLSVNEFLQSPYDPALGSYQELDEDPSESRTRVKLNYGEATGIVQPLHQASNYNVDFPTASAGIRGTVWNGRVTIDLTTGIITSQFTCTEGLFSVTYETNLADVGQGETIEIDADLGPGSTEDNPVVINIVSDGTQQAPPALVRRIQQQAQEMLEALNAVTEQPSRAGEGEGEEGDDEDEPGREERITDNEDTDKERKLEAAAKSALAKTGVSEDKINQLDDDEAAIFLFNDTKRELLERTDIPPEQLAGLDDDLAEDLLDAINEGLIPPDVPELPDEEDNSDLLALGFTNQDLLVLFTGGITPDDVRAFVADLNEADNADILDAIFDLRDPVVNPRLVEAGELANTLIASRTLSGQTTLPEDIVYNRARLFDNDFNLAVLQIMGRLSENDLLADGLVELIQTRGFGPSEGANVGALTELFLDGDNVGFLGTRDRVRVGDIAGISMDDMLFVFARDLDLENGLSLDVSEYLGADAVAAHSGSERVLLIGGLTGVSVGQGFFLQEAGIGGGFTQPSEIGSLAGTAGTVSISAGENTNLDNTLIIGSAENLDLTPGTTVSYDGARFIMAARDDIQMVDMRLEAGGKFITATLNDLVVENSIIDAPTEVILFADNDMTVDGLSFMSSPESVYMEAITLSLQNVDFPSGAEVALVSQFGGVGAGQDLEVVGGRYPVFGNLQVGRVNFIDNVRYGGALIDSETAFDTVEHQIDIRPFPGP